MAQSLDTWREAFLTAAEELFVARGYQATTVRQIAAAAGSHSTVFYRCFVDKEECHETLMLRHTTCIWQRVSASLVGSFSLLSLLELVREFFAATAQDRFIGALHAHPVGKSGRPSRVVELIDLVVQFTAALLPKIQADLDLTAHPHARGDLAIVLATVFGWCAWQTELEKLFTADQVTRSMEQLLTAGIEKFYVANGLQLAPAQKFLSAKLQP